MFMFMFMFMFIDMGSWDRSTAAWGLPPIDIMDMMDTPSPTVSPVGLADPARRDPAA